MKKDLVLHFMYMVPFFALIVVFKNWFEIPMIVELALGGLLGTFIPYLDYLIYAYVVRPSTPTNLSQVNLSKSSIISTIKQYYSDKSISSELIIHSALFQVALAVFVVFVATSSGSLLARGIVYSMSLHLILDQLKQYMETKSLDNWFSKLPITLELNQQRAFVVLNVLILLVFSVAL